MQLRQRIDRAKGWARFAGAVAVTALTVAALGALWAMLHDAEREGEAALLAALAGDDA